MKIVQPVNLLEDASTVVAIEQWNVYVMRDGKEHYATNQFVTSIVLGLMESAWYEKISIYLKLTSTFFHLK